MPRLAVLSLDRASDELLDTGFFASDRVENSVDAVDLKSSWLLMRKRGCEMVHGMFKHVDAVNENVLGLRSKNVHRRWCDN